MRRPDLVPDCESCAALCCVAPCFEASADFAFDKAAGVRCPNLTRDQRCAIHAELAQRGFPGCVAFDCYGAGQRVTRAFAGVESADRERNEAFSSSRVVHELLWQLTEAAKLCPPAQRHVAAELAREIEALDAIAREPARARSDAELALRRAATRALLRRLGEALGARSAPARERAQR